MKKLIIKAKHFKGTSFTSIYDCTLARAGREQFKEQCTECVNGISVGGKWYTHRRYGLLEFEKDKIKAKGMRYSNKIVKRIILKPEL